MEVKGPRFQIYCKLTIHRLKWVKISLGDIWNIFFKEKEKKLKLFLIFTFKIYSITLDPNWAKIRYPDPNSMYLDPQYCSNSTKKVSWRRPKILKGAQCTVYGFPLMLWDTFQIGMNVDGILSPKFLIPFSFLYKLSHLVTRRTH